MAPLASAGANEAQAEIRAERTGSAKMNALGTYDTELQMFVEPKRELDPEQIQFLRWLAEQGRLEHPPAGPPTGELGSLLVT
jgi:hypothetical protein